MKPEDFTDANIKLKKTSAVFFKELFENFGVGFQKNLDKTAPRYRELNR